MQASTIDMDYNFLKKVAKSKQDGQGKVNKLDQGTSMTRRRKIEKARRKRSLAIAKERGVEVVELPMWMERRKRNRTKLNRKYVTSYVKSADLVGHGLSNGRLSGLLILMVRPKLSPMIGTRPLVPDF